MEVLRVLEVPRVLEVLVLEVLVLGVLGVLEVLPQGAARAASVRDGVRWCNARRSWRRERG